jgi:membrane protein implicated in regulation of membrane protease activity
MNPWIWGVAALVVAFLELHAPGFYLIWIALGAAITAIVALTIDLTISAQLITFAVASLCSCVAGSFVYRRALRARSGQTVFNQRDVQMVGSRGIVSEPLKNGHGKIRLGDSVWLAEGPDLPAGTTVVVKAMRGTSAIVEAVE